MREVSNCPTPRERVVALLGGSFNPAHAGHLHISRIALRRLGAAEMWWLVSPQNPLKQPVEMASYAARVAAARTVAAADRRIRVSTFEAAAGTRYTVDTLRALFARYPGARFVWVMGGDNLVTFDRWRDWQRIAALVPIAVIARPGATIRARLSRAARMLKPFLLAPRAAARLAGLRPPALVILEERLHPASATAERRAGRWP